MKANAPSATAYLIAASTYYSAADPLAGRLIQARSAELSECFLAGAFPVALWPRLALRRAVPRLLVSALERATIPGIQLHYAVRKLYLDGVTRAALSDGIRQVVVLGAGYDTLALRLCEEFRDARFIETDHPATQRRKVRALARRRRGSPPAPPNLHFLPVNLSRPGEPRALLGVGGYGAGTLFIAEGLLMYLAPREVDELFKGVRGCAGTPGRFAFTFMEPGPDGRANFRTRSRAVDAWLALRGEPFKWGIERGELPAYLSARGFAVRELADEETLRRRYLEPRALSHLPLAAGECVCVAEFEGGTSDERL